MVIRIIRQPMRWVLATLAILLLILQYRLWFGEGSYAHRAELTRQVEQQGLRNSRLEERNSILAEEVDGLRQDASAIEERARTDLGMVKNNETFFLVLDKRKEQKQEQPEVTEEDEVEPRDAPPEGLLEPGEPVE